MPVFLGFFVEAPRQYRSEFYEAKKNPRLRGRRYAGREAPDFQPALAPPGSASAASRQSPSQAASPRREARLASPAVKAARTRGRSRPLQWALLTIAAAPPKLGSGLIDHIQKMKVAAMQMAEKKV